jgi:hypothetical protein
VAFEENCWRSKPAIILNISGNTITLDKGLDVAMTAGDSCHVGGVWFWSNDIHIDGCVIDGGRVGVPQSVDWTLTKLGKSASNVENNVFINNCTVKNIRSGGFQATNVRYHNCKKIKDIPTGLYHHSTTNDDIFNFSEIINCNIDSIGHWSQYASHNEGIATASLRTARVKFNYNNVRNVACDIVGRFNLKRDYDIQVIGNSCIGEGSETQHIAIFTVGSSDTTRYNTNLQIEGNNFENCGDIVLEADGLLTNNYMRNVTLSNNNFENSRLYASNIRDARIEDNDFEKTKLFSDKNHSNRETMVEIEGAIDVDFVRNTLRKDNAQDHNCNYGLLFNPTSTVRPDSSQQFLSQNVLFESNKIEGFSYCAGMLRSWGTSLSNYTSPPDDALLFNVKWIDNVFIQQKVPYDTNLVGNTNRYAWTFNTIGRVDVFGNTVISGDSDFNGGITANVVLHGVDAIPQTFGYGVNAQRNHIITNRTGIAVRTGVNNQAGQNLIVNNFLSGKTSTISNNGSAENITTLTTGVNQTIESIFSNIVELFAPLPVKDRY